MKIKIELNLEEISYLKRGLLEYIKIYSIGSSEWRQIFNLYTRLADKELELCQKENN